MESTLILHHSGYFQRYGNGNMEYVNGQLCLWEEYDIFYLSKHQVEEMTKLCGNYAENYVETMRVLKKYGGN